MSQSDTDLSTAPPPQTLPGVDLRILVFSNASFANTGYGVQARYLIEMFQAMGCTVAEAPFWGVEGGVLRRGEVTIYPKSGFSPYSDDIVAAHAQHFQADIIIALMDSWVLDMERFAGQRLLLYVPVDHEPIPPAIAERLRACYLPVMYSQFAVRMAAEQGITSAYAPHAIDTQVFYPEDRQAARARLGWPADRPIMVTVGANKGYPSRKNWPQMIRAFAEARKAHPDLWWYCHTNLSEGGEYQGMNLRKLAERFGVWDAMTFPSQYQLFLGYPDHYLRDVYSAADLFVLPSGGEGFGVPFWESLACGTPVLTTNVTAQQDLAQGGAPGWYLPQEQCEPWATPLHTDQFVPQGKPLAALLVQALDDLAACTDIDATYRQPARAFAEAYDLRRVALHHWYPIMRQIAHDIGEAGRMRYAGQAQHGRDVRDSRRIAIPADRYAFWLNRWSDIQSHLPLLYELASGTVVELGTRSGVSTSPLLAGVAPHGGHVFSVDLDPESATLFPDHPDWTFIQADSRDSETVLAAIGARAGDVGIDLLLIDTEHTFDQVTAELERYAPLVRPGGHILFHDIHSHPPVLRAIEAFLRHPEWAHLRLTCYADCDGRGMVAGDSDGLGVIRISEERPGVATSGLSGDNPDTPEHTEGV